MTTSADRSPRELAHALRTTGRGLILVVTGAGVSAGSGLPTFRSGPDAVWRRDDLEIGTREFFEARPVEHWRWYLDRFGGILDAEPNRAHAALAGLESWHRDRGGDYLLVTQNIDTLHERAGSERMIKVHGSADRLRCSRDGCALGAPRGSVPRDEVDLGPFREEPAWETLPRCPECEAPLRAHALFFDELYDGHVDYGFERVRRAVERMRLVLFVGTSFAVGVTELVLRASLFGRVPAWSVDPDPEAARSYPWLETVEAPAEEALEIVRRDLEIELPPVEDRAPETGTGGGA